MMFWSEPLKVVLATIHVPLADVPRLVTVDVLADTFDLTARELPRFGIASPRLALAGLNPHAGEDGLLGSEEERVLRPAVDAARARGVNVAGPFPGDTVFVRASRGEFDAVIACYHDQGLIPVKLLAFGQAVNVTLGLPIIRTSVDHGTAFDIAGKGVADPSSMITATLLAARLAAARVRRRSHLLHVVFDVRDPVDRTCNLHELGALVGVGPVAEQLDLALMHFDLERDAADRGVGRNGLLHVIRKRRIVHAHRRLDLFDALDRARDVQGAILLRFRRRDAAEPGDTVRDCDGQMCAVAVSAASCFCRSA